MTEVKLHSLYIVKDTALAHMYEAGEVTLSSMEEYMERVILFLSYLRPDIVIQRIVGRASGGNTLAVNGGSPWWDVEEKDRRPDGRARYHAGRLLRLYRRKGRAEICAVRHKKWYWYTKGTSWQKKQNRSW